MDDKPRVHMRHIRGALLCSRGAREWFKEHNLSWTEFLEHGTSFDDIANTNDHFGQQVLEVVLREHEGKDS